MKEDYLNFVYRKAEEITSAFWVIGVITFLCLIPVILGWGLETWSSHADANMAVSHIFSIFMFIGIGIDTVIGSSLLMAKKARKRTNHKKLCEEAYSRARRDITSSGLASDVLKGAITALQEKMEGYNSLLKESSPSFRSDILIAKKTTGRLLNDMRKTLRNPAVNAISGSKLLDQYVTDCRSAEDLYRTCIKLSLQRYIPSAHQEILSNEIERIQHKLDGYLEINNMLERVR